MNAVNHSDDRTALYRQLDEHVDDLADEVLEVSHRIWAEPELCFQERFAHEVLCTALESHGLDVTRSAYGLDTAFEVAVGSEGRCAAVLCEYDALPDIGHACGHNVIAAAGLGAGLVLAPLAAQLGGRLRVLGTPAEEGGGGKVFMLRAGAFDDVDVALMVHPADRDLPELSTLAIQRLMVEYHGEASHAAAAPHLGRNALDAAVLGYVNVAALRQHIAPGERVHGVIRDGGQQPNIVPRHAASEWYVRSTDAQRLDDLKSRVLTCLQAGASAAGVEMEHTWVDPPYEELRSDQSLLGRYARHSQRLGRPLSDPSAIEPVVGSTDMGNVSQVVPSIHPLVKVAPEGVSIHTPEFAADASSPAGDAAVLDAAKAMAATVVDVWLDASV